MPPPEPSSFYDGTGITLVHPPVQAKLVIPPAGTITTPWEMGPDGNLRLKGLKTASVEAVPVEDDGLPDLAETQQLQALVDMLVDQVSLGSWRVRGEFHPPSSEFRGQVRLNRYFNQATIYVCTDEPPENWDLIVTHELMHLLHDDWSTLCHELIHRLDSEKEREIFRSRVEEIEEPVMNRLAEAIVGRPWPYTRDQDPLP